MKNRNKPQKFTNLINENYNNFNNIVIPESNSSRLFSSQTCPKPRPADVMYHFTIQATTGWSNESKRFDDRIRLWYVFRWLVFVCSYLQHCQLANVIITRRDYNASSSITIYTMRVVVITKMLLVSFVVSFTNEHIFCILYN